MAGNSKGLDARAQQAVAESGPAGTPYKAKQRDGSLSFKVQKTSPYIDVSMHYSETTLEPATEARSYSCGECGEPGHNRRTCPDILEV